MDEEVSKEVGTSSVKFTMEKATWVIAGTVLLGSIIVAGSILFSLKPMALESLPTPSAGDAPEAGEPAGPKTATTSLDNDAVLGDRTKAKVAIVEYSDYECPFCQRFHKEAYAELIKQYVDTGKAVYSFRDYPLQFHEPNASKAANAAECVRQAKGDQAYFAFSKLYFDNTQSNGKGLAEGKMDELLRQVGVNVVTVNQCVSQEKFKDEIAKDMTDGQAAGVSGTPSFVIGTLDAKGNVTGELIVGAMPFAQFKTVIEKYLQ